MAILGDLLVQGSSRFLQHIYASGLTVSDDFSATGNVTIAGTLTLTKTQDLSGTANNGPALIIGGAATSTHMEIDRNKIQAKKTGTTTDILYLNHDGGEVQISKSGVATKILGTLTTSGAATFSSTTTFSGASTHSSNLTVNGTTSLKGTGISGTLNVSGDTTLATTSATDLTVSNNAKVNKTLIVEEEIRSPKWIIDNIANLGGEFIVAPTIIANTASVQIAKAGSDEKRIITVTDNSITSDVFGGISWSIDSIVKISGTLGDVVLSSVNGTMTEKLNTSSKVLKVKVASTDLNGIPPDTTTYSVAGGTIKNLHIMMYKVGGKVPVGIYLTSYGNSIEHYPYLEVYSGTTTGTSYSPTVRLGYLPELKDDNGATLTVNNKTPTGWGLYTSNGYFSGTIVSNSGKIGGWEIGTASLYNGTTSMNDTNAGLYFGSNGEENPKWGIRSYNNDNQFVNIIDGIITAKAVDLSGKITATSGKIGKFDITNTYLWTGSSSNATCAGMGGNQAFWAGHTSSDSAPFRVAYNGAFVATSATIEGKITSTSGSIGGFTIGASSIYHTQTNYNNSPAGVYIGTNGIGLGAGKFYVTSAGSLKATSGTIAGWTIGDNTISHGTLGATKGYMLNSAGNSDTTINGTRRTDWALTIGSKFGIDDEGNLYANGANITNITIGNTDLQVGGRNLLGNTGNSKVTIISNGVAEATFMNIGNYNDAVTLYSFIDYDGYSNAISVGSSTSTGNRGVSWYTKPGEIIAGQKYTFSCKIKCSVATNAHMHTAWRNGSATATYTGWTSEGAKAISANVWTDYVCTFTPNSNANLNYEFLVAICITGVSGGATYQVAHAKLEEGNVATAWTPAPEDVNQDIVNAVNGGGKNLLKKDYSAFNQTSYCAYVIPTIVSLAEIGEGTILTFQAWGVVPDSNNSGIYVYWGGGSINLFNKMLPDENGYICQTITVTSSQASHSNAGNKFIHIYNFVSGHSGMNLTIDHWKLEQGSVPTPWSLASEDIDYAVTHIDGGNIITGTVAAAAINAQSGTFNVANIPDLNASKITSGTISANLIDTASITIGQSQVTNLTTDLAAKATTTALTAETNQRKAQYGTSSTAAGTAAKVVTCANFALYAGARIKILFSTANSAAAPTLNVNSTGAKAIWVGNTVTSTSNPLLWSANTELTFVYDGTRWLWEGTPGSYSVVGSTAAGTAAKVTDSTNTINGQKGIIIVNGTIISYRATTANTAAAPTLNVASTGAAAIHTSGAVTSSSNNFLWAVGDQITFTRNSNTWILSDMGVKYITRIDNNGITVHPSGTTNNRLLINANGTEVFKGNTSVAFYGDTARIGKADSKNVKIDSDSIDICDAAIVNASFTLDKITLGATARESLVDLSAGGVCILGGSSTHNVVTENTYSFRRGVALIPDNTNEILFNYEEGEGESSAAIGEEAPISSQEMWNAAEEYGICFVRPNYVTDGVTTRGLPVASICGTTFWNAETQPPGGYMQHGTIRTGQVFCNYNIYATSAKLDSSKDASGTANNSPALIIGNEEGTHLEFDANEIMAKGSATTTAKLNINGDGGEVEIGDWDGNHIYFSNNYVQARNNTAAQTLFVNSNGGDIVIGSETGNHAKITLGGRGILSYSATSTQNTLYLNPGHNVAIGGYYESKRVIIDKDGICAYAASSSNRAPLLIQGSETTLRVYNRSTSYINGMKGEAAVHIVKGTGNEWSPIFVTETKGGGAWACGNYNDEGLDFVYMTATNFSNNTNTISNVVKFKGDGTIQMNGKTLKGVYRLYNQYDKCYLFTADTSEKTNLVNAGWTDQGIVFYAFK